jgi:hypothetical protein
MRKAVKFGRMFLERLKLNLEPEDNKSGWQNKIQGVKQHSKMYKAVFEEQ